MTVRGMDWAGGGLKAFSIASLFLLNLLSYLFNSGRVLFSRCMKHLVVLGAEVVFGSAGRGRPHATHFFASPKKVCKKKATLVAASPALRYGATRVAFSLVTFFWRSKRKLLAAGPLPASKPQRSAHRRSKIQPNHPTPPALQAHKRSGPQCGPPLLLLHPDHLRNRHGVV